MAGPIQWTATFRGEVGKGLRGVDASDLGWASMTMNQLKDCRHGKMLFNVNDVYVGRSLQSYGEYSEGECEVFRQLIRPGMTVLELGANIGSHTDK